MIRNWKFSQSSVKQVLEDIRSGNTEYTKKFFEARPDWVDKPEGEQEAQSQEQEETAQA